jgi:hypothetical protein
MAGQQAPVGRRRALRRVDFQGLHKVERNRLWKGLKLGMAPAADRAGDLNARTAQGNDRPAGRTAGGGRQSDGHPPDFGKARGALKQARPIGEHTVWPARIKTSMPLGLQAKSS